MIYEMCTYQLQAGKVADFLKVYEANGVPIITRYAKLVGCYDDFGSRTQQRAKLGADPQWQAFVPTILPYLIHQESVFMLPAAFSPLK